MPEPVSLFRKGPAEIEMYREARHTHNWLMKKAINGKVRARLPALSGCVLDLGCGVKPFGPDILSSASIYIGVDWNNSLHGLAADVVADLNRCLPFDDSCVDHVVSFEVLEHLCEPGVMLQEAFRILRSGGEITLSVPFQWRIHEVPWDFQRYTCHGLEYQLSKRGFEEIRIEPTTGFWSMWVLKFNYYIRCLVCGSRWRRMSLRILFTPIWWLNQMVAPAMDQFWPEDSETAGYFATARKP